MRNGFGMQQNVHPVTSKGFVCSAVPLVCMQPANIFGRHCCTSTSSPLQLFGSSFLPESEKRAVHDEEQHVHMLSPSQARPASAQPRPVRGSSGLHRCPQHFGLSCSESLSLAEELGLDMLASMSFADLKVGLPTIASGVLFSLPHHGAEWSTRLVNFCVSMRACFSTPPPLQKQRIKRAY